MSLDLQELYNKMLKVHEKTDAIFEQFQIKGMLRNEFNNKVNQYTSMYESVETMKSLATSEEAIENLINQQIEILNVRIQCELNLAQRAINSQNN